MRGIISAALLCLVAASAHAQDLLLTGVGTAPKAQGGGGGYTGPGDVVSGAIGWWGLRAYDAAVATAGTAAANICTESGGVDVLCTDIHVTATGGLNATDLTTSGCAAINTCTCKTLYDQSGNGHNFTQATVASRPIFYPNGVSTGLPACYAGPGSNGFMAAASLPTVAVGYTFEALVTVTVTPGGNARIFVAGDPIGLLESGSDHFSFNAGTLVAASGTNTLGTFYALIGRTDGTAAGGVISQSGTITSGLNAGSTSTGTPGQLFASALGSNQVPGYIAEVGYWSSNISTGTTSSLNSNMRTYWGI